MYRKKTEIFHRFKTSNATSMPCSSVLNKLRKNVFPFFCIFLWNLTKSVFCQIYKTPYILLELYFLLENLTKKLKLDIRRCFDTWQSIIAPVFKKKKTKKSDIASTPLCLKKYKKLNFTAKSISDDASEDDTSLVLKILQKKPFTLKKI